MKLTDKNTLFPGVKNYRFIYCNDGPAQFVFTWGTTGYPFKVNGVSARAPNTAVLLWGYHPKTGKRVILNGTGEIQVSPKGTIKYGKKGGGFFFEYGDTKLRFGKEYRPMEFFKLAGLTMGANEFRAFSGKLFGHKVKGNSLLQLYKVSFPFASWDWFRFHEDGYCDLFRILEFAPSFRFGNKKYPVKLSAGEGKLHMKSSKVDIVTEPYAREDVHMSGLGKFRYTEFFVKVKGKVENTKINTYGIVEEARGFIF